MKKIIAIVKPFDKIQYIHIYEDGECLCSHGIPMDQFSEHLPELAAQYMTDEVDIAGPKTFTNKLKEEIETYSLTHYNDKQIKVNLI